MSELNQSSNESTAADESEASSAPQAAAEKKKGRGGLWGVIIVVIVLAALAVLYTQGVFNRGDSTNPPNVPIADLSASVAKVNGVVITRGEFNERFEQYKNTLQPGAVDPSNDASVELALLDELVNLKLLTAEAESKNYTVTEDEVDAAMATIIAELGGEEVFNQQLAALGINMEELRENMRNELLIRQLIDAETDREDVVITDEEIVATYDAAVGEDTENAPALDDVREVIREQLIAQKSIEIVEAYIAELRSGAEIEITL